MTYTAIAGLVLEIVGVVDEYHGNDDFSVGRHGVTALTADDPDLLGVAREIHRDVTRLQDVAYVGDHTLAEAHDMEPLVSRLGDLLIQEGS